MQLKIDGDILSSTIKTLQKIVQVQQVSAQVRGNFIHLIGIGNGNAFSMSMPCTVVKKSKANSFTIGAINLLDAVSKRKEVTLDIQESAVIVTASRYKAELLIQPYEELVVVPEDVKTGEGGLKIKDKFLNAIREQLPKLELKPLLAMYDFIPFGIKSTKEGTFIACFDFFQSAFYFDKELTGKLEFTLPSSVFSLLAKELKGQNYTLSITDAAVYAFNDTFELAMARPQSEGNQVSLENMLSLYESLQTKEAKKSVTKIVLKKEGITALLENAKSVYEKDSTFSFSTQGNKCKLELQSSYGKVTSMVMLDETPKKDVSFTCDFNFFSTLLAKAPATVELRVTDRLMLFVNKPVTYLLSLV